MSRNSHRIMPGVSIAALTVLFIALVILSDAFLKGQRLDLTSNGQYTLNEGTRSILVSLEEPVNLYLFFSEESSRNFPQVRRYAQWVGDMLDEMADLSGGRLKVNRVDPRPFSKEEDQASQFGLQAVPTGSGEDMLYFGLVGTNSLDGVQLMPFLQPVKEKFLEYDLAKMISSLAHPEQKKVGWFSGIDMQGQFDPATQSMRPAWVMYEQLDQMFDLEIVSETDQTLPAGLDLLMLVHPKQISDALQYEIDQFVLAGGRLAVFLDPFAEADQGGDPADPMARLNAGSSSNLQSLLAAWGVSFDSARVVGDARYAMQVGMGNASAPVRHITILSVSGDGLNAQDISSADLEAVNFSSAGWLQTMEGASTEFTPLVQSSQDAAPVAADRLRFLANPLDLLKDFEATGERYTLAARLSGSAESAFEQAPESAPSEAHLAQSGENGINVVLFADTDLLSDRLWVQKQNFLGQLITNSFADNGNLVVNVADHLLGSPDLIRIRTRATSSKPFERVQDLRLVAEERYRSTEERLQQELDETERKLAEMQSSRNEGDLTILSKEQQDEVQRFIDQRLQIRTDLREVRHNLDQEIDALGTRLKVVNIVLIPLLVIIAALFHGHLRRRRREQGAD